MFSITAEQVIEALASDPSRRELYLREPSGALVRTLSRHEAHLLCSHDYVCGKATRRGLSYLQLIVARLTAVRLLNRLLCAQRLPLAEDNRTVERQIVEGGIVWSHRANVTLVWSPETRSDG